MSLMPWQAGGLTSRACVLWWCCACAQGESIRSALEWASKGGVEPGAAELVGKALATLSTPLTGKSLLRVQ
jgi:hypothetical protein